MDLKCVRCGAAPLEPAPDACFCRACGSRYRILRGVPRFVDQELYAESFGFEWKEFARTQLDSANGTTRSRDTFLQKTGWRLEDLRGKRVLDAGCGMGRFAEICADAGAEVYAIDMSLAVDAAYANLAERPNVHVLQADIMDLPFLPESFDFIYSIGVLHHTPDTRKAFLRLTPLLRPGGTIAVWVYATRSRLRLVGSSLLRTITPSLPKGWLLKASRLAIPLYQIHRTPILGRATSLLLYTSMNEDPEWRWLDTFDWYSPRYQWKHTYDEVEEWYREAGLGELLRGDVPVSVSGRRLPARPSG